MLRLAFRSRLWAFALAIFAASSARPQWCDTSEVSVGLSYDLMQGYDYSFTPLIDTNGNVINSVLWEFTGASPDATSDALPYVTFSGPGYQLACLTAYAVVNGQDCQARHCELIEVSENTAGCDGVSNDFTIEYNAPEIVFISQSISQLPITEYLWDFGDGNTGQGATASHTYAAFGAYHACLTITTGDCITTHCRWIYLGPDQVPCDSLLTAEFNMLQMGRTVGLWDASTASGMDIGVSWTFGDGQGAQGPVVVHTYDSDGFYTICAAVSISGQLVQDTCGVTVCHDVFAQTAQTGVQEIDASTPRVYPQPFSDVVNIEWPLITVGGTWQVLDMAGRELLRGPCMRARVLRLDLSSVCAGPLLLRLPGADGPIVVRLLKQ